MYVVSILGYFERSTFHPDYCSGRRRVTAEKSFLLTIWYLSNRETFREIADRFNVSLSSAYRCLNRTLNFILSIRNDYIKWPNQDTAAKISAHFKRMQGIEDILGAIDGCHVGINRPKHNAESYINRKGFYSALLQGICDNKRMFIEISCGFPGSLHDARVLRKSSIFNKAQDPNYFKEKFLIGDSAYPCLNWLVPPYKDFGHLMEEQKSFNYKLSSSRMVIENAYGVLKGRFRRLHHFDNLSINVVVNCIMAACTLHNICLQQNDDTEIVCPDLSHDLQSHSYSLTRNPNLHTHRRDEVFRKMFRT